MDIDKRIRKINRVKQVAESKVKTAGTLFTKKERGCLRYYSRNEKHRFYLGEDQQSRIKELEEKYYYQRLLKVATREEKVLLEVKKLLKDKPDFEKVFFELEKDKRHLISPYQDQEEDETVVKKFLDMKVYKKHFYQDKYFVTQNGEKVRSKSELIIADKLLKEGIPYYYEAEIVLEHNSYHPDFTVLNKRTGQIFYWEHLGMMDNPEYCAMAQERIELFAEHGISLKNNLIITMESSQHNLNTGYVDRIISEYLK